MFMRSPISCSPRAGRLLVPAAVAAMVLAGCSSDDGSVSSAAAESAATDTADTADATGESSSTTDEETQEDATGAAATADDSTSTTPGVDVDVAVDDLGAVGTLASTEVHDISVEFDDAEFEAMVATYTETGDKEWISATVTIDGTTYENVGLRLKGNSSLRGVTADDDPATIPWLVKLDEFVEDQNHEGLEEFVVRSSSSTTGLNEAVALELLDLAGLASQDAIAVRFSANGGEAVLRLVIDHPDGEWMEEWFSDGGALYKAESTGDWSYRGDDPAAYDDVFDQEAGQDNADLTPLIELLQFVEESDDATFEAELPEWLDVESFATYLAMQDLLDNFDDIDGPGNNAYLYWDTETEQFTVVPWDYNLAFGQRPGAGAGGGLAGDLERPMPPGGVLGEGEMPTPAGGTFPEGFDPDAFPGGGEEGGRGPGGMERANPLVDRFLAVDEWSDLYELAKVDLQAALYDSGVAGDVLSTWASIVAGSGLVDQSEIDADTAAIARYF